MFTFFGGCIILRILPLVEYNILLCYCVVFGAIYQYVAGGGIYHCVLCGAKYYSDVCGVMCHSVACGAIYMCML